VVLIVTSLLRDSHRCKRLAGAALGSIPRCLPIALLHALLIGTDKSRTWLLALYGVEAVSHWRSRASESLAMPKLGRNSALTNIGDATEDELMSVTENTGRHILTGSPDERLLGGGASKAPSTLTGSPTFLSSISFWNRV